ncbi:MAG TPA: ATP-binding cassette domain-containing protein [Solirubrobacteraceae bacterium]|nr:ATP-binding cassette domain-containing protein [Solirubrobacteraceae bacterium]
MNVLACDGLRKVYDGRPVVDDVSFAVQPGEVVGFLRPNGAGKTTTLRLLLGLAAPGAGHAPDGLFCLDYLQTSEAALLAQDAEFLALPQRGPRSTRVTLMGRRWIRAERVQLVNFYTEDIDPLGRTLWYLGSTTKAIVDGDELRAQLDESGFEIARADDAEAGRGSDRPRRSACSPAVPPEPSPIRG